MKSLLLLPILFSANFAMAAMINCKIKVMADEQSQKFFSEFNGGKFAVDTDTRNAMIQRTIEGGATIAKVLTADDLVTVYAAKRETCQESTEMVHGKTGELLSAVFKFEGCELRHPDFPNPIAYVSSWYGYNFETGRGLYQDMFYDGGVAKTPGFFLENCTIQ